MCIAKEYSLNIRIIKLDIINSNSAMWASSLIPTAADGDRLVIW